MSQQDLQSNEANKSSASHETNKSESKTETKKTNINKRKLDEYDNNIEPNNKRRKVNKNEMNDKLTVLIKTNESYEKQINELEQENNHIKHGINLYKQKANEWKTQYMQLYSQLCNVANTNTNAVVPTTIVNEDININNDEISPSPTPPPSKYFHKPTHQRNHDIIIQTPHFKHSTDEVDFEDSYHFSVNCHLCKKHFDAYDKYNLHLKQHYTNDPNKIWKECELCDRDHPFVNPSEFISHIANHKNVKPFKCNVIVNGKKCGVTCNARRKLKEHWNKYHTKESKKSNISTTHSNKKRTKRKLVKKIRKIKKITASKKSADSKFENSYYISVNCHMCKEHFDDIYEYRAHLKQEYDDHANKTWLKCDFCKYGVHNWAGFAAHIATHTKQYAYRCNITVNGNKCEAACASKGSIKSHFNNNHRYNYDDSSSDYSDSESSSSYSTSSSSSSYSQSTSENESELSEPELHLENQSKTEIDSDEMDIFERNYIFSMSCHFCKQHFDHFLRYKHHIKNHYDNHETKNWLECEFGCKKGNTEIPIRSANPGNFVAHIAMHLNQRPFKCDFITNQTKCTVSATVKGSVKNHFNAVHNRKNNAKPVKSRKLNDKQNAKNTDKSVHDSPVILCSNLTSEQTNIYEAFKKMFINAATFTLKWQHNVTHLITPSTIKDNKRILSARTIKYFQGIVTGSWILCFDWVKQCVNRGKLIDENKYEILGDLKGKGACKKSRELRQNSKDFKRLFDNIICVISSKFTYDALDEDLRCIFTMGGAIVFKILPYEWLNDVEKYKNKINGKNMIFVYDKEKMEMTSKQQLDFVQKFNVLIIAYQDVFDAISNYKSITDFIADEK